MIHTLGRYGRPNPKLLKPSMGGFLNDPDLGENCDFLLRTRKQRWISTSPGVRMRIMLWILSIIGSFPDEFLSILFQLLPFNAHLFVQVPLILECSPCLCRRSCPATTISPFAPYTRGIDTLSIVVWLGFL